MKVDGYDIPDHLYYIKEHEWVLIKKNGLVKVGITDYAQKMLREINFIYLSKKDLSFKRLATYGTIESIKAISELYIPFTGTIVEINEKTLKKPRIINEDPYGEGWIIIMQPSKFKEELKKLITPKQYAEYVKELIKIDEDLLIYRWRAGASL